MQPIADPLRGHTDSVTSVAFSPDGKTIASGSEDNTAILWDIETLRPIGKPLSMEDTISSIAFSPDGKILALGSGDYDSGVIMLWDTDTLGQLPGALQGHEAGVESVAFSPDGVILASLDYEGTAILWDVETRQPIGEPLDTHSARNHNIAFSPNGGILASTGYSAITLWDTKLGLQIGNSMETIIRSQYCLQSRWRNPCLGSTDRTIQLWDVNFQEPITEPQRGHTGDVTSVAFTPDGKNSGVR